MEFVIFGYAIYEHTHTHARNLIIDYTAYSWFKEIMKA
jgi:hypothetical protein